MHLAILGSPTSWYAADLERAAAVRGHRCSRLEFAQLIAAVNGGDRPTVFGAGETPLADVDAVVVRTMPPGSLEQVVFRMDVLARLEAAGTIVLNGPKAIECAVDKFLTTSRLAAVGVPVPETVVCEKSDAALQAFERLGGDVVVKPVFGAEGRGIVRVSDPDLAFRTFRALERIQAVLYVQRYVDHGGWDIRVLLFDGDILGGMRRFNPRDFRVNVSRSGSAELHDPTERERELARLAAEAAGTRFCGVDLLYDRDCRCYVIEVNAIPGWQAFSRVTGFDVAAEVVRRLEGDVAGVNASACPTSGSMAGKPTTDSLKAELQRQTDELSPPSAAD
jgi:RimK family alpha-L-glutamate ligase